LEKRREGGREGGREGRDASLMITQGQVFCMFVEIAQPASSN